mgnify:CR=1 FL=1
MGSVDLPDQGEVWSARSQIDEVSFENSVIETFISLPVSGLELTRRVTVDEAVVRFDYRLGNPLSRPVPYLWAFHPLLTFSHGDRIELPEDVRSVVLSSQLGLTDLSSQRVWTGPEPAPGVHLDCAGPWRSDGGPAYVKLFADFSRHSSAWAALASLEERLVFRFDPKRIPHLGLWITNRGWHGYTHVALEPASAASDILPEWRSAALAPGSCRTWQFRIELHTS